MKVKSAADIAAKWARVTPGRSADFKAGVTDTSVDWHKATVAAADSYSTGVQTAIGAGRFQKGVEKAGNAKWQRKAADVGVTRWGPGVAAAQPDMEAGMGPMVDALTRLTLPPRGPRNDPRNLDRVAAVTRALADARNK